jgi:hypothetical protein
MKLGMLAVVVVGGGVAYAETKIDLHTELSTLAAKYGKQLAGNGWPVTKGCTTPTKAESADAKKRALAWIDTQHPNEIGEMVVAKDSLELEIHVGCKDASGAVVLDVSQDRERKKAKGAANATRRNYVLRVSSTVEVIAEDESSPTMSWSEWADEGRISLLAQVDVDGDGVQDIVYSDHEHEGGSTITNDRLHVKLATGTVGEAGDITELADVQVLGKQLVIAASNKADNRIYVCVGRDLHLAPCAAAKALQLAADRYSVSEQIAQQDPPADKDVVAAQLTTLGVSAKKKAQLVALAPEAQPEEHLTREVTAWMVKAGLIEPSPMPELVRQTHPEAQVYLDELAKKLGDGPCSQTKLTAEDEAKAAAWIKKQDAKAFDVMIAAAACGPFTWAAWESNPRREVLLGRDGTRLLGFTTEQDGPIGAGFDHTETWFTHDGVTVGVVIGGPNLWVIANGKVVATSKGDKLAPYRADDRWSEIATSVFIDGGTLWHATPTGREKLDRALIKDHEERRAAIALLSQGASKDPKYIAALQLLGADKSLIAEAKKLP